MTPTEQQIYFEEARKATIRKHFFYTLTGKTHLQFLNYWIARYKERFGIHPFDSPGWEAYFKRRLNFVGKLIQASC